MAVYFRLHINEATCHSRPFPLFLHPHIFPLNSIVLAFSRAEIPPRLPPPALPFPRTVACNG